MPRSEVIFIPGDGDGWTLEETSRGRTVRWSFLSGALRSSSRESASTRRRWDLGDAGAGAIGLDLRAYTLEFLQLETLSAVELAESAPGVEAEVVWRWSRPVRWADFLCLSLTRARPDLWRLPAGAAPRLTAVSLSAGRLRIHRSAASADLRRARALIRASH